MKIRFLQTTPSNNPDFPFQAGQVIDLPDPSSAILALLDGVQAEVVLEDPLEAATVDAPKRAVQPRAKGRTA